MRWYKFHLPRLNIWFLNSQCGCWGRPLLGRKPPGEKMWLQKQKLNIDINRWSPASQREASTTTSPLALGLQYATGRSMYSVAVAKRMSRLLPEGWYRFSSPAGSLLPTECPGYHHLVTPIIHGHNELKIRITVPIILSRLFRSLFDVLTAGGNYCGTNIPVWMKGESETPDRCLSASRFVQIFKLAFCSYLIKVSISPEWKLSLKVHNHRQQEPWQLEFKVKVFEAFFWTERSHVADSMALQGPSPSQLTSLLLGLSRAKTDLIVFPEKVGG